MHTPTTDATAYQASHIRRRVCSTKAEINNRRGELYTMVSEKKPMTSRPVFYQATVRVIVEKAHS
jgi:hypothetical protein